MITAKKLRIPDVVLIEPKVYEDNRGFFYESFNHNDFSKTLNDEKLIFVQDNHSKSSKGVLRGLHYQIKKSQGKLVRVIDGEIFDVAVDLRKSSPFFGMWVGELLSSENRRQLWIPAGFAHGFLTITNSTQVLYKTTDYYEPSFERCIKWDDPDINIQWPLETEPIVSSKDMLGKLLSESEVYF